MPTDQNFWTFLAGRLSINATSPTVTLRVFADNTTLRLLYLGLPSTLSLGSTLSQLGMSASSMDSSGLFTLTNTTVKYVPLVNGQTGEGGGEPFLQQPFQPLV